MENAKIKRSAFLLLTGFFALTSCGHSALPAQFPSAPVGHTSVPHHITFSNRVEQAIQTLKPFGITLNTDQATSVQHGSITFYNVPTNRPETTVTLVADGATILSISVVRSGDTMTVTDLETSAVTITRPQADGSVLAEDFGYADLDVSLTAIISDAPPTEAGQAAVIAQAAALKQCTGSVPANLLQARTQAQNDISSFNNQIGIAIAGQVLASGAVALACGATVITVGVATPACIAAGSALTAAILTVEDKTRARNDAVIRAEYAQLAITQWKSDTASNNACAWY